MSEELVYSKLAARIQCEADIDILVKLCAELGKPLSEADRDEIYAQMEKDLGLA